MIKIREFYQSSTLVECFNLFTRRDKIKVLGALTLQIIIGAFDLLGIAIIGILGALAVTGIQSNEPGDRVSKILELLSINSYSFQKQVLVLAILAVAILLFRTIVSILITRVVLRFIARKAASLSSDLLAGILSQTIDKIQANSIQSTIYSVSNGVTRITLGIIGGSISLIADMSLVLIMVFGLFLIDAQIAIFSVGFFVSIGYALYKLQQQHARSLGIRETALNIESNQKIYESLVAFREISTKGMISSYVKEVSGIRFRLADTLASLTFLPNISKYVIEASIVLGALLVSAFQFVYYDAKHAVATLAVFVAAASRISPAILRAQQGLISIKNSLGSAQTTLSMISEIGLKDSLSIRTSDSDFKHESFIASLSIKNVHFAYSSNSNFKLENINLEILPGEFVALVGPSGSGKSTLADLFMGVLPNSSGEIELSGLTPKLAISKFPGAIAYVPQSVEIFPGSVASNVSLGFPNTFSNTSRVISALKIAKLDEYVSALPEGLESSLSDRGIQFSGGQRQRLGIARALFSDPRIVIFDEATSALDGLTEKEITESLMELKGRITIVMIAHRLSSIRNADKVVYLDSGKILAIGTFDEIRRLIPNFDLQASAMGL